MAAQVRATVETYLGWEWDRHEPEARHYPAIFRFLGYDPFPEPVTLPERITSQRRKLGLTINQAARKLQVDKGTFSRWESGEWEPRKKWRVVQRFLDLGK